MTTDCLERIGWIISPERSGNGYLFAILSESCQVHTDSDQKVFTTQQTDERNTSARGHAYIEDSRYMAEPAITRNSCEMWLTGITRVMVSRVERSILI